MNEAEKLINRLYGNIGFTCDSCGRETNGITYVNGMKFCAKCYQETFGNNNQQNEIQQLKEQLEALILEISKQKVEQHDLPDYCTRTGTDCTNLGKIEELQQQLAEKDKEINSLIIDYEKRISQEQELMSNLEKQLAEKEEELLKQKEKSARTEQIYNGIIVDKDKEIEKLKQQYTILENENGKLTTELIMDKYKKAQKEVSFGKQLAIQELEKVKSSLFSKAIQITGTGVDCVRLYEINKIIDQQIKELKGEKDE